MSDDYNDEMEKKTYLNIFIEHNYYGIDYGEMCGAADLEGNIVIPVKNYQYFIDDFEYIFVKEFDSDWEAYFLFGEKIKKIKYDDICYREDEFLAIKVYGKSQFYDLTSYNDDEEEEYE
jgi:hypothetical protein